jgi:alpha-L-rhamnosidase
MTVFDLLTENQIRPLGLGEFRPRFSWKVRGVEANYRQKTRRIQVSSTPDFTSLVWDSKTVRDDESHLVVYRGRTLEPKTRYWFRVRVAGGGRQASDWSEPEWFETSLAPGTWPAPFVSPEGLKEGRSSRVKALKQEFELPFVPHSARLYATALGLYEMTVNGQNVTDAVLTPGWTAYQKRLAYQSYDVTALLKSGTNTLGALVGPGWYKGELGWQKTRNWYGSRLALSVFLEVKGVGGEVLTVTTDETWSAANSALTFAELYHGETYDARLEGAERWTPVTVLKTPDVIPFAQDGLPVRRQERFPARKIDTPEGDILDFGQNLTGWVRFTVEGKPGDRVVLLHAETLDAKGNFYTKNLRNAKNRVEYILKGAGKETFEPRFSFQGFRYVKVEKWPGEVDAAAFEAVVVHSDMEATFEFECSHSGLNQLHHNIVWSWKGNAVDIPSDCPQRDERLGWTGDAQIFVATAARLRRADGFFRKWLRDLRADQREDGGVPSVIPDVLETAGQNGNAKGSSSSAGWGDAAVIVPWNLWRITGDLRILEESWTSMQAWVEYIRRHAADEVYWDTGFHFGDWGALDAKEGSYFGATPNDLTATAYYAFTTGLLARTARVLGKNKEARVYKGLYSRIVRAFLEEFLTPNGRLAVQTQTAHILALELGLLPEEHRQRAVAGLANLLEENKGHLSTGFLGTPAFCDALSRGGRLDLAYSLLLKEDYPSWLYPVFKGATTVWEHWDGMKPDGTMGSSKMNSFNHCACGAVGDWMYRTIGGIELDSEVSGYKRIVFHPQPGGGLTWARSRLETPYGSASMAWTILGESWTLDFEVPPNTTAALILPGGKTEYGSGRWTVTAPLAVEPGLPEENSEEPCDSAV